MKQSKVIFSQSLEFATEMESTKFKNTNNKQKQPRFLKHINYCENDGYIKNNNKVNTFSENLLSHPEYNSSIYVIKKLKEIKSKKIINTKHVLPIYPNFLKSKVSAALDFRPFESVYKNLINLAMDDNIPRHKFIRSKEPEFREKDIVPLLSHFYIPKKTKQYFVLVRPMFSYLIKKDILNSFSSSNKTCAWNIGINNFLL